MNTILYLGTDPSHFVAKGKIIHCPIIRLAPKENFDEFFLQAWKDIDLYTHIIFTSKNAVRIFFEISQKIFQKKVNLSQKTLLSIGSVTSQTLEKYGYTNVLEAKKSTQEGVIDLLQSLPLEKAYIFYPRSSQARELLTHYLLQWRCQVCDLYDTIPNTDCSKQLSSYVEEASEIVFTSPSTVQAFFTLYGKPSPEKKMTAIGPITQKAIDKIINEREDFI